MSVHVVSTSSTSDVPAKQAASPGVRLTYMDGIRGLTALYIVIYHLGYARQSLAGLARHAVNWTQYGHFAVNIFIVISGYCLMLPVIRSRNGEVRGGLRSFFKRRALRILPTYYAALLLAIVLVLAKNPHGSAAEQHAKLFAPDNLVAHLFLFENLSERWHHTINSVLWSVSLEWQIYFLFPLLLLPLWRRFGLVATLIIIPLASVLPHLLLSPAVNLDCTYPWLVGLFTFGMAGAAICHSNRPLETSWRERIPWGTLALALFGVFWAALTLLSVDPARSGMWLDMNVGLFTFCFLIYCTRSALQVNPLTRRPLALRLLETRGIALLGRFSYSLYLIHLPVWWVVHPIAHTLHLTDASKFAFQMLVGVPFCVLFAYLFHQLVESRFLPTSQEATKQRDGRIGVAEVLSLGAQRVSSGLRIPVAFLSRAVLSILQIYR